MTPGQHNNLWLFRRRFGFPQKVVARLLGHGSTSIVSEYERGVKTPPLPVALKFQHIYGVPLTELFPGINSLVTAEVDGVRQRFPHIARYEDALPANAGSA